MLHLRFELAPRLLQAVLPHNNIICFTCFDIPTLIAPRCILYSVICWYFLGSSVGRQIELPTSTLFILEQLLSLIEVIRRAQQSLAPSVTSQHAAVKVAFRSRRALLASVVAQANLLDRFNISFEPLTFAGEESEVPDQLPDQPAWPLIFDKGRDLAPRTSALGSPCHVALEALVAEGSVAATSELVRVLHQMSAQAAREEHLQLALGRKELAKLMLVLGAHYRRSKRTRAPAQKPAGLT